MPVIESYFLDTNILVKTLEYLRVKEEGGDVSKLESYYAFYGKLGMTDTN